MNAKVDIGDAKKFGARASAALAKPSIIRQALAIAQGEAVAAAQREARLKTDWGVMAAGDILGEQVNSSAVRKDWQAAKDELERKLLIVEGLTAKLADADAELLGVRREYDPVVRRGHSQALGIATEKVTAAAQVFAAVLVEALAVADACGSDGWLIAAWLRSAKFAALNNAEGNLLDTTKRKHDGERWNVIAPWTGNARLEALYEETAKPGRLLAEIEAALGLTEENRIRRIA